MVKHPFASVVLGLGLIAGWFAPHTSPFASSRPAQLVTAALFGPAAGANLASVEGVASTHDATTLSPETLARLSADLPAKITVTRGTSANPLVISYARSGSAVGLAVAAGDSCRGGIVSPQGQITAVKGLSAATCSGAAALAATGGAP